MLSIIDTGPKDTATAYIPKDAAVPADVSAKLTRHMQSSIPIPQTHTIAQSAHVETLFEKKWIYLLTVARLPSMSMITPKQGTKKNPIQRAC